MARTAECCLLQMSFGAAYWICVSGFCFCVLSWVSDEIPTPSSWLVAHVWEAHALAAFPARSSLLYSARQRRVRERSMGGEERGVRGGSDENDAQSTED